MSVNNLVNEILSVPSNLIEHPTSLHVQRIIQCYINHVRGKYRRSIGGMPTDVQRICDYLETVHLDPQNEIYKGVYEGLVLKRLDRLI